MNVFLHSQGGRDMLKDVWKNVDMMDPENFDPKLFFKLHGNTQMILFINMTNLMPRTPILVFLKVSLIWERWTVFNQITPCGATLLTARCDFYYSSGKKLALPVVRSSKEAYNSKTISYQSIYQLINDQTKSCYKACQLNFVQGFVKA